MLGTGEVGLPKVFLRGIENCDIQILHEGLSSKYFTFLHGISLPRIILILTSPPFKPISTYEKVALDVFKSRPGLDLLSIWISKLLLNSGKELRSGSPQRLPDFTSWLHFYAKYQYGFRCRKCNPNAFKTSSWNFLHSTKNLYPIVVTNFELAEALQLLRLGEMHTENLMIWKLVPSGFARVCSMRIGWPISKRGSYDCVNIKKDNMLKYSWKLL